MDKVWAYDKKNKYKVFFDITKNKERIDYFFNLHNNLSLYFLNPFILKARKVFQYKKDAKLHAVLNFAKTYSCDLNKSDLQSDMLFDNDCTELLKKYNLSENGFICFAIGVGSARPHRGWPFEKWLALTKKIFSLSKKLKIVFLGGESEKGVIDSWVKFSRDVSSGSEIPEIIPEYKGRLLTLAGRLSLSQNADLISRSLMLVSCDTGLLHLGAALSKKIIGIYGPTLPERTGPFAEDCILIQSENCKCINKYFDIKKCKLTCFASGYCMNNLSADEVCEKIILALKQSSNKHVSIM